MTLDIRGSIKNTKLSSNLYVVFEELVSNAIDSFLIRKHSDPSVVSMRVEVAVDFSPADMLEDRETMTISCKDNGCGLGEEPLKAFLTMDTSYKDDLSISGIGKCKGAGRIQFFHHFSAVSIDSTYRQGGDVIRCEMRYSEPQKQIDTDNFRFGSGSEDAIGTTLRLEQFKESVLVRITHSEVLSSYFSASILKKQMLVAFLQRLVGLDTRLDDFEINFITHHWKNGKQTDSLRRSDLPTVTAERVVEVKELDAVTGNDLGTHQSFKLSHYQLDADQYDLPKNAIAFCAKSSPVRDITARYLRTRSEQNNPLNP